MAEPISQFPEGQMPELTQAQAMIDFAFTHEAALDQEDRERATHEIVLAATDIQAGAEADPLDADEENLELTTPSTGWQRSVLIGVGNSYTHRTVVYEDGSMLRIELTTPSGNESDFQKENFGDVWLRLSAEIPYTEKLDETTAHKFSSVQYKVGHNDSVTIAMPEKANGFSELEFIENNKEVDAAGFDPEADERLLRFALTENSLLQDGIDPDSDPEIAKLREENEGYRKYSDFIRKQYADIAFEQQFSTDREVGLVEALALTNLLRSV